MYGMMIQGTASDVGKSLLLTALCRLFVNDGYRVAPFKSQNMSNNIYVTPEGKEISKAQALQAKAAKQTPNIWMNPIVLKPNSNLKAEVIMLGRLVGFVTGKEYRDHYYERGLNAITHALAVLKENYDMVIMEGAGSPVEVNLKEKELVNMKVAEIADVPVLLVADIDRGGVFASIVGTMELLSDSERRRVQGIIINKFRGDRTLFADGKKWIENKVGVPVLGVIPYIEHGIEAEDSLSEKNNSHTEFPVDEDPFDHLANEIKEFLNYEEIKQIMKRWNGS